MTSGARESQGAKGSIFSARAASPEGDVGALDGEPRTRPIKSLISTESGVGDELGGVAGTKFDLRAREEAGAASDAGGSTSENPGVLIIPANSEARALSTARAAVSESGATIAGGPSGGAAETRSPMTAATLCAMVSIESFEGDVRGERRPDSSRTVGRSALSSTAWMRSPGVRAEMSSRGPQCSTAGEAGGEGAAPLRAAERAALTLAAYDSMVKFEVTGASTPVGAANGSSAMIAIGGGKCGHCASSDHGRAGGCGEGATGAASGAGAGDSGTRSVAKFCDASTTIDASAVSSPSAAATRGVTVRSAAALPARVRKEGSARSCFGGCGDRSDTVSGAKMSSEAASAAAAGAEGNTEPSHGAAGERAGDRILSGRGDSPARGDSAIVRGTRM